MLPFGGPNSTTCSQMRAINRPSEVPPVVDSSVRTPVSSRMACSSAFEQRAARREERQAADAPREIVVQRVFIEDRVNAALQSFHRTCRGEAEIEHQLDVTRDHVRCAPCPLCRLDTCHVVGGKYSLPSSQCVETSSASAGASK